MKGMKEHLETPLPRNYRPVEPKIPSEEPIPPAAPGFYLVYGPDRRPVSIVDETNKVLATSADGNWWKVVEGVKTTVEFDNFITSLASIVWK